ncbi:unnamed protein product [Schistosoma margrebowiei]|uniref:Uncharacterized protein n=1 Tax=Schistosoma margrebowiei TaxID=48269 RepID=A0A183N321_9TREM|nr:unnamed protein product [Schistosoma margrebowiei]
MESNITLTDECSCSNPDLNDTQNDCETKVSNQPISCRISHVIASGSVCLNVSHISDNIFLKFDENMASESNHVRNPYAVLTNTDFSNDPLLTNEILNKFEENISEESNSDIQSNVQHAIITSHLTEKL